MESATGQTWAEDFAVTDSEDRAGSPGDDEYEALRHRLTFTREEVERSKEELRRQDEEWVRRFWGDRKPFPIPEAETDA
jgi:hypothetical protein